MLNWKLIKYPEFKLIQCDLSSTHTNTALIFEIVLKLVKTLFNLKMCLNFKNKSK